MPAVVLVGAVSFSVETRAAPLSALSVTCGVIVRSRSYLVLFLFLTLSISYRECVPYVRQRYLSYLRVPRQRQGVPKQTPASLVEKDVLV